MATTKVTGKQIKFTTAQAFTGSGGAVSNGMIFDNGVGLVLSGMRIYTAQLTPDSNNEVASKKYVDDNIGGGSLQSGSVAFGQIDGSGFVGDGDFQYLTGSAGFGGGLFYGDMQAIGDSNGPKIRAALTDGAIPGVGTGSIAFNVARVYLTGSAQVALKSGDNLVLEAADDVTVESTSADGEIKIVTAHTAGRAVHIDANANAGSIVDIDAGILDIDVAGEASTVAAGALVLSSSSNAARAIQIGASGGTDAEIHISSAGTGAQSINIDTDGSIDIDSNDNIAIDAADNISITTTSADGLLTIHSAHTLGQAILIDANAAAGSILDIDAGVIDADTQGEANFTAAGALVLSSSANSARAVQIGASGGTTATVHITSKGTAANAIDIDTDGGVAIDAAGVFSVDAVGTSNVTTNGALTISGSTGLNLASDSGEIDITSRQGNIDINGAAIDIDATGAVTIDSSGGAISIGADDIDQAINIGTDGTRTITIGESADSTLTLKSLGGTFTLDGTGQTVDLNSAALDIDASGAITIDTESTFSIDGVGTSNVQTHGALILSGSDGISVLADTGDITLQTRVNGFITGSASGVLIGAAADMALSAGTFFSVGSGKAMSISVADGGLGVSTGADDNVSFSLGNNDGGELFAVTNSDGATVVQFDSALGTTLGIGSFNAAAPTSFTVPAFIDNCATVTAHASGAAGNTNGSVVAGSGIAEIYMSGTLGSGQSIFLTGGLGAESLYANSLRVFNNGILLLSGASSDYTTTLILTGTGGAMGGLRVDFVDQPLVTGDVLQFHVRAKGPAT